VEKVFSPKTFLRGRAAAINGLISYAGTPNVPPRCVRERAWEKAGSDIMTAATGISSI